MIPASVSHAAYAALLCKHGWTDRCFLWGGDSSGLGEHKMESRFYRQIRIQITSPCVVLVQLYCAGRLSSASSNSFRTSSPPVSSVVMYSAGHRAPPLAAMMSPRRAAHWTVTDATYCPCVSRSSCVTAVTDAYNLPVSAAPCRQEIER